MRYTTLLYNPIGKGGMAATSFSAPSWESRYQHHHKQCSARRLRRRKTPLQNGGNINGHRKKCLVRSYLVRIDMQLHHVVIYSKIRWT